MRIRTLLLSSLLLSISTYSFAQDIGKYLLKESDSKHIGELYDRLAADIVSGRPVVVTVYVAFSDNDNQGIERTKNPKNCSSDQPDLDRLHCRVQRKIRRTNNCLSDQPDLNRYWASGAGLWRHLDKSGYNRVDYQTSGTDVIAVKGVWRKRFLAKGELRKRGIKRFSLYIVGLAYRETHVHNATVDFLASVRSDEVLQIVLPNGEQIDAGGRSHIAGYVGHDNLMDVFRPEELYEENPSDSTIHKGMFALTCVSHRYFSPSIKRRTTHILALNSNLAFASAYMVRGIIEAVAAGKDHKNICLHALKLITEEQERPPLRRRGKIVYGDSWLSVYR